ncbi:GTPase [Zafaria sp. J156]|uniref:GTPase n=1 Tax=Zafaria sp. J156 TaxID=3116490 RepID=UPI002E798043|nr:GTPase [Zafaria sp. J156]MEE1620756.1 GTPase [Zafaria sp. J156]
MTRRRGRASASPLEQRLEALDRARELGEGVVPGPAAEAALAVLERATSRRSLSPDHTVVGFFGATGSGKSSLFNAVTGRQLARAAATRPTTSRPLAAVSGSEGSAELLDWLGVDERHLLDEPEASARGGRARRKAAPGGVVLLDLPDFDSTEDSHREVVERLAGQVDLLVWVLDPQKYADAAVHHGFIRRFAGHGAVSVVVLNQSDRLAPGDREPVMDSLRRILDEDGVRPARILATSAVHGDGVGELRELIGQIADSRTAAGERLAADVLHAADLLADGGTGSQAEAPGREARARLGRELADAGSVGTVVAAVEKSYRLRAVAATGWPPTRWLRKLRPDPLRRLNLHRTDVAPEVNRTSLPAPGPAQRAQSDAAVRAYADAAAQGVPEAWRAAIRRSARASADRLPDAVDQAVAGVGTTAGKRSWWWTPASVLQWLVLAVAVAGALWLGGLAMLGYLQFDVPPAPAVEGFPVPTLLLLGGIVLGVAAALGAGLAGRLAARQRARSVRRRLEAAVDDVAARLVVEPVAAELTRYNDFRSALEAARAG